jgi:hypothetical protein
MDCIPVFHLPTECHRPCRLILAGRFGHRVECPYTHSISAEIPPGWDGAAPVAALLARATALPTGDHWKSTASRLTHVTRCERQSRDAVSRRDRGRGRKPFCTPGEEVHPAAMKHRAFRERPISARVPELGRSIADRKGLRGVSTWARVKNIGFAIKLSWILSDILQPIPIK